jgi:hypothetical protein
MADRTRTTERIQALEEALKESLDNYEEAMGYKGDYFVEKHGDRETLARLRAVLSPSTESK